MILYVWASIETLGIIGDHQFNMYETEQNITVRHQYYDCLHYYVLNDMKLYEYLSYILQHQIISYCMRPSNISDDKLLLVNQSLGLDKNEALPFRDLLRRGVNSQQLLVWSASIDLVERYQIYLNNPSLSLSQQIFYKCSPPWFGPRCQYKFINIEAYSFNEIVKSTFLSFQTSDNFYISKRQTCYIHLTCIRGPHPVCLDWREVCDGKVDCLDGGQDEENCFELEVHECDKNEYRCHNGMQCIPLEFFHDNYANSDCTDRTDERDGEIDWNSYHTLCNKNPSFRCEEHSCRPELSQNFVCGNGECGAENDKCSNGRGNMIRHASNSNVRVR